LSRARPKNGTPVLAEMSLITSVKKNTLLTVAYGYVWVIILLGH